MTFGILALVLAGCGDEEAEPASLADLSLWMLDEQHVITDEEGAATFEVEIEEGVHTFLLRVVSEDYAHVLSLESPEGVQVLHWEDWSDGDHLLTMGILPAQSDAMLNWPVRAEDGPLVAGTWTATIAVQSLIGYAIQEEDITIQTFTKRDVQLNVGHMDVRVVYPEAVAKDAHVVEAVQEAVEQWQALWEPFGISMSFRYETLDIDSDLPYPAAGDPVFLEASSGSDSAEITLVIGETIDLSADEVYGVSGAIPGSLTPTERSIITVSWLACAGTDGSFNQEEVQQMAETMAHEAGHYSGLFHPVEISLSNWDALDDTPECNDYQTCEELLGANIMYPYPVCGLVYCEPSTELSQGQLGVAQRWTGML